MPARRAPLRDPVGDRASRCVGRPHAEEQQMTDLPPMNAASGCPPWCYVESGTAYALHARCMGEVLWRNGSVAVELAHCGADKLVVLSNFADDKDCAIANLTADEARTVRDALDAALTLIQA